MKLYEKLAMEIANMIESGVLKSDERIPSVRHISKTYKASVSTIYQAYFLLENRGLIYSKPRSGFFVCTQPDNSLPVKNQAMLVPKTSAIEVSDLVFSVLKSLRDPRIFPLGSAFPSPEFFPMNRLSKSLAKATKDIDMNDVIAHLPQGNLALRRQIIQRYAVNQIQIPLEELIITDGALEALNLCLQAVTKPGDLIAIESPAFYACLQAVERLQLNAVELPCTEDGIDLAFLSTALKKHPIKACWFMTNFHNPSGTSTSDNKTQKLVEMLTEHQIPLIEDDVYGELYYNDQQPKPAKAFDREGWVMHCKSFSKSLAPGYRVGWAAAGRFHEQVERLKLMTTLSTSMPAQVAIADYLQFGGYERHLRKLRITLRQQYDLMRAAIVKYFPASTLITPISGGYFLWLELPKSVNSLDLLNSALSRNISIAPGPIFSASKQYRNYIRLNFACSPWTPDMDKAVKKLGSLVYEQI
jgi:DNA-binding transcriptional MocR family regulator